VVSRASAFGCLRRICRESQCYKPATRTHKRPDYGGHTANIRYWRMARSHVCLPGGYTCLFNSIVVSVEHDRGAASCNCDRGATCCSRTAIAVVRGVLRDMRLLEGCLSKAQGGRRRRSGKREVRGQSKDCRKEEGRGRQQCLPSYPNII
jgi:hypothetical protein